MPPITIATHRIAGITFRTESNVPLLSLDAERLNLFRVGDDEVPDARHRIHHVPAESLTLPAPAEAEQARILRGARVELDALEGPLLRAPAVRAWLHEALDRPSVTVSLYPYQAIGSDYERRVVDYYYTDVSGPGEPETLSPVADDDESRRRIRMRPVTPDPRTAPPLSAEERARLAQDVHLSSPAVLEDPLLRAPAVRVRLHADLDQSRQVGVMARAGGLLLWTVGQDMLDFYYYPGVQDPREARVAGNYQRMFCAFLPGFHALPIHSAGVVRGDRAALFLASDEGGKTTVLRLTTEGHLLSDDQNVVRHQGDELVAHASPFGQLTDGPGQAPLGGLFVLHHAQEFALAPFKPADLVKALWDEHLYYTTMLPRHSKMRAFELVYEMCHRVPAYRMSFPKDFVDWNAIDAAMTSA